MPPESVSGRPLRVFVSSAMLELQDERQAIKAALRDLKVDAWVYEDDAGARDQTTRATYIEELDASDLYIGVFWKRYGAYTIDEYRHAIARQKPALIFVKNASDADREVPLQAFLREAGDVEAGRASRWFRTVDELSEFIKDDVARWQASLVRRVTEGAFTGPFQVEPLSDQYVDRPDVLESARTSWLPEDSLSPPLVTRAAFHGLGGSGKSVMARAFAHDAFVRRAFPDGVLWVTLERNEGQPIDFARLQSTWGHALRDPTMSASGYPDRATGTAQLRSLLQSKACLLIADDVWDADHVRPFLVGGPRCLLLITTRRREVVDAIGAKAIELSSMTADEATALVERWSGPLSGDDRVIASELADELGYLPLALELMAAQSRSLGWPEYRDRWGAQRLAALRRSRRGTGRENNVLDSLELSVTGLGSDAALYEQLAVFGPNTTFPKSAAAALWGLSDSESEDVLLDLTGQALLRRTGDGGVAQYSLHSLLHEYLANRVGGALTGLHARLLDGYRRRVPGGWHELPDDGYVAGRLAYHMVAAHRLEDLRALIGKPWMDAQFRRAMSHGPFLADLRIALQASRREPIDLPAFVRYTVMSLVLNALVGEDPVSLLATLAETGEVQLAFARTGALPQAYQRVEGYIAIADVLNAQAALTPHAPQPHARRAAEQALATAEAMSPGEPRAARPLASAAACLARCGGATRTALNQARRAARSMPDDWKSERVDTLAGVAGGLLALRDHDAAADCYDEMIRVIESSSADEALWLFSKPATALSVAGPIEVLHRLRDLGLDLVQQGIDSYVLSETAKALGARGEIDAALAAAERLQGASRSEVLATIARSAATIGDARAFSTFDRAIAEATAVFGHGGFSPEPVRALLDAATQLNALDRVAHLNDSARDPDAVWQSWFLAAQARAFARAGSTDRVSTLADEAVRILRDALKEKELHGEAVRAEAAAYLAEAQAFDAARALADHIDDAKEQKTAYAAIARHLYAQHRSDEARSLLNRALAVGGPHQDNQLVGVVQAALGLARLNQCGTAVPALHRQAARLDGIERGDRSVEIHLAALEAFTQCDRPELARQASSQVLATLLDDKAVVYDRTVRSDALLATARWLPDEFERAVSEAVNWSYRRSIVSGAIQGRIDLDNVAGAAAFVDALDAEKSQYPPWDESPRLDAFARLLEVADETTRRWILELSGTFQSPGARALLLTRAATSLVAEDDPGVSELARAALDVANAIAQPAERDQALANMADVFATKNQTRRVLACAELMHDSHRRDATLGGAAWAAAKRDDVASAVTLLERVASDATANGWIESVAQALLDRGQFDTAPVVFDMLKLSPQFVRNFAGVRIADARARAGQVDAAEGTFERTCESAQAHLQDSDHGLVLGELSTCAARLARPDLARELATRAEDHTSAWGPFIPASLAATFALLGDAARAQQEIDRTLAALSEADDATAGAQAVAVARTWADAGVGQLEPLIDRIVAIVNPYDRAALLGQLAAVPATLPPSIWDRLLTEAQGISEFWASVQATQNLVSPACRAGQRQLLSKIIEIAAAYENNWARGAVLTSAAAGLEQMDDDPLLERILTLVSAWSATRWVTVAVLAQVALTLQRRNQDQRARPLIDRAVDSARTALDTDLVDKASFDAELARAYRALGRTDEASAAVQRVLTAATRQFRSYQRGSLLDVLERLAADVSDPTVLQSIAAVPAETPPAPSGDRHISLICAVARRLLSLSHRDAALAVLDSIAPPGAPPRLPDDTGVRFQLAQTLAMVDRRSDAVRTLLEAADTARTESIWAQPAIYRYLSDALVALSDADALASMLATLEDMNQWWQPERRG